MSWQNLTEREQCEAEATNGAGLVEKLKSLGLTITGAGWMTCGVRRGDAIEMLRAIEAAGPLDPRTEESADCYAADLRRRFGL